MGAEHPYENYIRPRAGELNHRIHLVAESIEHLAVHRISTEGQRARSSSWKSLITRRKRVDVKIISFLTGFVKLSLLPLLLSRQILLSSPVTERDPCYRDRRCSNFAAVGNAPCESASLNGSLTLASDPPFSQVARSFVIRSPCSATPASRSRTRPLNRRLNHFCTIQKLRRVQQYHERTFFEYLALFVVAVSINQFSRPLTRLC